MTLKPLPSRCDRSLFLTAYGHIYESSPWVAEAVRPQASTGALDDVEALAKAMQQAVDAASDEAKLRLIRAHPELAGRAALAGHVTDASKAEQSSAALDQCTPDELEAFRHLNDAYGKAFGFPFIVAVKGLTRTDILSRFRTRLENDPATEFAAAIAEIHKIARFRLEALAAETEPTR